MLARAGYAARGVISCIVGALAAMAAAGDGGGTTDSKGAIRLVGDGPFGSVLLGLLALGLFGYAVWLGWQTAFDPEGQAAEGKTGRLRRVGWAVAAVIHAGLGVYAVSLLAGSASGGGDGAKGWTAKLMAQPFGGLLVVAAGVIVLGVAAAHGYRALKSKIGERLDLARLSRRAQRLVIGFGRFGLAARGVVLAIAGAFLVVAGANADPRQARGLGESLATIQGWSMGWLLLGLVGFGFVAYGLFQLVEARYRRIDAA